MHEIGTVSRAARSLMRDASLLTLKIEPYHRHQLIAAGTRTKGITPSKSDNDGVLLWLSKWMEGLYSIVALVCGISILKAQPERHGVVLLHPLPASWR